LKENIQYHNPPVILACKAYEYGFISKDELYEQLISKDSIRDITKEYKS